MVREDLAPAAPAPSGRTIGILGVLTAAAIGAGALWLYLSHTPDHDTHRDTGYALPATERDAASSASDAMVAANTPVAVSPDGATPAAPNVDTGTHAPGVAAVATPQHASTIAATAHASYASSLAEARRLVRAGDRAQARTVLLAAIAERPTGFEAQTELGFVEYLDHNYDAAASHFQRSIAINPNYTNAYVGMAEASVARGSFGDAIDSDQRYLSVFPNGPYAPMARREVETLQRRLHRTPSPQP